MDLVLLCEFLCERPSERVEICEGILGDLGTGGAAEEECFFGIFNSFGSFLVQSSFGARVAWFSYNLMSAITPYIKLSDRYICRNILRRGCEINPAVLAACSFYKKSYQKVHNR